MIWLSIYSPKNHSARALGRRWNVRGTWRRQSSSIIIIFSRTQKQQNKWRWNNRRAKIPRKSIQFILSVPVQKYASQTKKTYSVCVCIFGNNIINTLLKLPLEFPSFFSLALARNMFFSFSIVSSSNFPFTHSLQFSLPKCVYSGAIWVTLL